VGIRFDPVMCSVRSGLPATALVGKIELIESDPEDGGGGGLEGSKLEPPPQPTSEIPIAIRRVMPVIRNIRTSSD
jgi:hypothetical protein